MVDLVRYQDLTIDIVYPDAQGTFPVILFSHAEGGCGKDARDLAMEWAKKGFICILPSHIDMVPIRPSQGLAQAAFPHFPSKSYQYQNAIQRVEDLKFILDSLEDIQNSALPQGTRLSRVRIGVGGISFGAYVAQLLGGAKLEPLPGAQPRSVEDPRPMGFLLLSPQGADDSLSLSEQAWDQFTRPMMVVTGGLDMGPSGMGGSWRKQPFERSPAGGKLLLWFDHGMAKSFLDPHSNAAMPASAVEIGPRARVYAVPASPPEPSQQGIFELTAEATSLFWQCMLYDSNKAKKTIKKQDLETGEGVSFQFATR